MGIIDSRWLQNMKIELIGVEELSLKLLEKSKTDFSRAGNDTLTELFNRASSEPYTPFDTGELRHSRRTKMINQQTNFNGVFGYSKDYAPHVEYGHRTRGGGYVPGQYYLQANVEVQRPLYKSRLLEELKK